MNEKLSTISFLQPWNTPVPTSSDGINEQDKLMLIWDMWKVWEGGDTQSYTLYIDQLRSNTHYIDQLRSISLER